MMYWSIGLDLEFKENNLHRVFPRDELHNYVYDLKIMILCSSYFANDSEGL
jgi:hypothetical protein